MVIVPTPRSESRTSFRGNDNISLCCEDLIIDNYFGGFVGGLGKGIGAVRLLLPVVL